MSSLFVEDGVPLLRGQNVLPYSLDLTNLKYISQETHRKWKKSALKPGDVVIVRVGYPGTASVIPCGLGDLNAASLVIVRPNPNLLDSKYLAYVINSPWGKAQVAGRLVGAAQQVFNTKTAAELEIPAPPLPVQQRIAGILSAYDELIENSQRRIKILESMARALYREWFVHFRFPGFEHHPRVASPLGEIPQGWEVKKLGDLITYSRRATKPGAHLEDRRYVPIDCLPPKSLALLEAKPIEEAQSSLQLFEKGDILFGAMRPYFHKVVVAPFAGVTRTTCFVFKPVKPEWHAFATMTTFDEETVAYANSHSQGATIPYAVWDGSLSEMPIVLPAPEVLERFEGVVAPMLSRLVQSFFTLGNLRRTRDLLLPRLLSGQIDMEKFEDV
jgi:type I restriction enzyme S subunit